MMIASSMGLGHVCRALAIIEEFDATVKVDLAVHDNARSFIEDHRRFWRCEVRLHRLVYNHRAHFQFHGEVGSLEPTEVQRFVTENAETIEILDACDVVVNDWIPLGAAASVSGLRVGLYHSPLAPDLADDHVVRWWKRQQVELASRQDVFVHMSPWGLADPTPAPVHATVLRVPLILRSPKASEPEVRGLLRIPEGVPYVVTYGEDCLEQAALRRRAIECTDKLGCELMVMALDRAASMNAVHGHDLIRHATLVIAKPGMSILSECLAAGTPQVLLSDDLPERRLKQVLLEQVLGTTWWAVDVARLEEGIAQALARSDEWRAASKSLDCTGATKTARLLQSLATEGVAVGAG